MKCFRIYILTIPIILFFSCSSDTITKKTSPLKDKIICIDPGHGGTAESDSYRVGPTGEREEWIDLRVALILKDMLEKRGAVVLMTRSEDVDISLRDRALLAKDNAADLFISIHHNATADSGVNFPIIYFHGNASENRASVVLGKIIAKKMMESFYIKGKKASLVSDHTIFPNSGTAVLRLSYGIPGIIGEASFFTNPGEELRLKDPDYNRKEAEVYFNAIEEFFYSEIPNIKQKYSLTKIKPFPVFQEAERMKKIAKRWQQDFWDGKTLFESGDIDSLKSAFNLFSRSVKSFPDSYLARQCFVYRSKILEELGSGRETREEIERIREYYVDLF